MARPPSVTAELLPRLAALFAAMFFGFLSVSLPLPVLALHVHATLGFSTIVAGLSVGLQSFATILTRAPAGRMVDRHGAKPTLQRGLLISAAAGSAAFASALLVTRPAAALAVLLIGRLTLGVGESLLITGVLTWAILRAGPGRSGRAMEWNGMAQYAALAAGAPVGFALDHVFGFGGVALASIVVPLIAYAVVWPLAPAPAFGGERLPLLGVLGRIWQPGVALSLAGIGFAAISAFATLDFAAQGWPGAGYVLLVFGIAFVTVRVVGSGLADRVGGRSLAAGAMGVATVGQILLWLAPGPATALVGAALTGMGCSPIFPALALLAVRRVPDAARGIALGAFVGFQDLALGLTGPLLGTVASLAGFPAVFLVGAFAATAAAVVSLAIPPRS